MNLDPLTSTRRILESDGDLAVTRIDSSALDGKNVFITGASGLIGTGIIAALRSLRISGVDLHINAHGFSKPPQYLLDWQNEGHLKLLQSNLADPAVWDTIPVADIIIHAAGYGQPGKFMDAPLNALMLNTGTTAALLKKISARGSFLFLSSTEIYQGIDRSPFTENDIGCTSPDHPRSSYIEGKRCGEAFCYAARSIGIRASAVRLAHTYGPGTRPNDRRVINMFIEKALKEGFIALQDQGGGVRTWGYITDIVETCLNILISGKELVYNVGGHSKVTIRQLADRIAQICGVDVILPQTDKCVPGAPQHVEVDLTRSEAEFNKVSYVSLEEGLHRTIDFQRQLYS